MCYNEKSILRNFQGLYFIFIMKISKKRYYCEKDINRIYKHDLNIFYCKARNMLVGNICYELKTNKHVYF